jgi:Helix-turn-helix domain
MSKTKTVKRHRAKGARNKAFPIPTIIPKDGRLAGALRARDAAHYIAVSIPTLRRLVKSGLLRPSRPTRYLVFPISELERFLNEGMVE